MDGVSAFALVVNVCQAVELGVKLARACFDLRDGRETASTIGRRAEALGNFTESLVRSSERGSTGASLKRSEQDLLEMTRQCATTANALRQEALKLEVPRSGSGRKRQIFKVAWKNTFGTTRITRLEGELSHYQNMLQTRLMGDLR